MSKPTRIVTSPTVIAIAHLVLLLQRGMLDMHELADGCGLSIFTVNRYCAAMHRAGAIHIASWRKDARGAQTIRIYLMGEGIDAVAGLVDKREKARRMKVRRRELRNAFFRSLGRS